jgi:hypothetical protein
MSSATARKPARSSLMCEDFVCYFKDVIDTHSKSFSSQQILNIDDSGVTTRSFKGKKQKMISLTNCQTAPSFQDARGVSSSLRSNSANLHTRPTKPQLEGRLLHTLPAWHNASYAGGVDSAWRLGAVEVKRPGGSHHPDRMNRCTIIVIVRKACSDAQEWFAESDG